MDQRVRPDKQRSVQQENANKRLLSVHADIT